MNSEELDLKPNWDREARFIPAAAPVFHHRNREAKLRQPYVGVWINSLDMPVPVTRFGCHLRKNAEVTLRRLMNDDSSHEMNHHTRYYIWDSSFPGWNPRDLNCWTPIAARPRDQWVPSR